MCSPENECAKSFCPSSNKKLFDIFSQYDRSRIKPAESFQCFGIKLFSRAALQTASISGFSVGERTAQVSVSTPENFTQKTDLFTKDAIVNFISVSDKFVGQCPNLVLRKRCCHNLHFYRCFCCPELNRSSKFPFMTQAVKPLDANTKSKKNAKIKCR